MKKAASMLLCAALLFLWSCSGNTVISADASLSDISAELQSTFESADVSVLNSDYLILLYGLDSADYSEAAAFRVKRLAFPDEVIMLKANDEAAQQKLTERLNDYRSSILEQSRSYEPESYAMLEKCSVECEGLYVWMFLSAQSPELSVLFRAHLKEYSPDLVPVYTPVPISEAPFPAPESVNSETMPEKLPWGLVPESERAEDAWFQDSIVVGTSVTENLRDYVFAQRLGENPDCMGNTVFFTAVNFCYMKAIQPPDLRSPALEGDHCSVEEAVARTGAKRVYLNLGYGDLALRRNVDVNLIVSDMDELVRRIREKSPDVTVIVLSVTPRLSAFDRSHYGAPRIRELNSALLVWAEAHESYYIDCYTPLSGEDGGLLMAYYLSYGPEDGAHLNKEGTRVWLDTIYTHTIP